MNAILNCLFRVLFLRLKFSVYIALRQTVNEYNSNNEYENLSKNVRNNNCTFKERFEVEYFF